MLKGGRWVVRIEDPAYRVLNGLDAALQTDFEVVLDELESDPY
jgi:hypothetical protein